MAQSEMTLSLNQICRGIFAVGGDEKTYVIEGPMGSGKSSLVEWARERYGDKYNYAVVDCTQWDVGDVQIPDVDKVAMVVRFLPNVLLIGDGTKPIVVLLDEIGKASRPVQNALLPVMLEHRVGAVKMPAGSIVVGATNLGSEGVGDLFQNHARNRVSFLTMRYPTFEEWKDWAIAHNVHPALLVWAKENEKMIFGNFADYPNPDDFIYGFHPKAQRKSFVTPRSLYLASIELREDRRAEINDWEFTLAAIAGNIGMRAALDMQAFVELADKMPAWSYIINDPENAPVPKDNAAALVMTVFRAVTQVERDTFDNVMTYIQRIPREMQSMFAIQLMRIPKKSGWVALNMQFTKWVKENHWMVK